jgi:hypothetical protein
MKIIARLFGKIKSTFNTTAATTPPTTQRNGNGDGKNGESESILFHHWQRPGEVRVITL